MKKIKKFRSIKSKLIVYTMLIISGIFAMVLATVSFLIYQNVNNNIKKSETSIRQALIAKGKTLAGNNAVAMQGMVEDNSFTAVQSLVSSTVADDEDIEYGIFMDDSFIAWVDASSDNPGGQVGSSEPMGDVLSLWAGNRTTTGFTEIDKNGVKIIEFASPVEVDEEILGVIRYGFSTESMRTAINESLESGKNIRNQLIFIVAGIGLLSLVVMYLTILRLSTAITRPINRLVRSANTISEGRYDDPIIAESNDEIGNLAGHFDAMRLTVKQYTDHLQELVDEKMQQVNDILNNIDQGLFTINLDGSVNEEYSARANAILKVKDVASNSLKELLRMDPKQERAFNLWMDLVRKKHGKQRWKKLTRLAPVRELELPGAEEIPNHIAIEYQKIYKKNGSLSKIMVLALDETEKRIREIQMEQQRIKHESEVKIILGLVNTPVSELSEFMEDTIGRMTQAETIVADSLSLACSHAEAGGKDTFMIPEKTINLLYRDIHTIKGNSGSYGFERLSEAAHNTENILESLREKEKPGVSALLNEAAGNLKNMHRAVDEIREKITLIYGKEEDAWVRIPKAHVKRIVDACAGIDRTRQTDETQRLIDNCIKLSWIPVETITRKYQKIVNRAARNRRKNIRFTAAPEHALYPPDILYDIDAALIHLVRNAADHGIESPEVREDCGKGIGRILLKIESEDTGRVIRISDDGGGVNTEKIVERCIEKELFSQNAATALGEAEKIKLIFTPSISTSDRVTDLSGRGMGMHIVKEKIESIGGTVSIESELGKGTAFTLNLPPYSGLNRISPISGFHSVFEDLVEDIERTAVECTRTLFGKEAVIPEPWKIAQHPKMKFDHLVSVNSENREFQGIALVGIQAPHIPGLLELSPEFEGEIIADALGEFANIFSGMVMDIPHFKDRFGILRASPPVHHEQTAGLAMWGVAGSVQAGEDALHIAFTIKYKSQASA